MANVLVLLSDLQCACSASGRPRTSAVVENSWVLLVDSQSTMMPATVNVNRLAAHQPNLEAGSVYSLTGFESFPQILLAAVKSTVTDPPQDKNRVVATIKMDNDTYVTMSLFDSHAVEIHAKLEQMGADPKVVVATSVIPKMVGGRLLVQQSTGLAPVAPLLKSYAKVEKLSISELNDFVLTAASQWKGYWSQVGHDKGWCYVSCSKCFKKLHRSVSTLTCQSCNNTNAVGVLRYRVEMFIADSTGEALFVAFDGVMAKLHNMRANEAVNLLAGDGVNPEEADAPPFVRDMEGRSFTFQVKVGPYNFTANHQSFTISRILSEGDREPQPDFADDGGDDDNGGDNNNGDDNNTGLVKRKMDFGGGSKSGGPSAKVKRARKA
ncbi:hypothetical protein DY000_02038504 [Brassica cretica]|uniref:Replication factor A C-terminal domain-containing protein n=3 Tax=Brassica TaxID=3705 RepID=A0ABQ7B901_BRACR|nr:hypothetical protein DY000_02038504 [Brassica cretica]